MTAEFDTYYDKSLYNWSVTYNKWVPLSIADFYSLDPAEKVSKHLNHMSKADNISFFRNHPINFVIITGICTVVQSYNFGMQPVFILTVDDGTGRTLEVVARDFTDHYTDLEGRIIEVQGLISESPRFGRRLMLRRIMKCDQRREIHAWKEAFDLRQKVLTKTWNPGVVRQKSIEHLSIEEHLTNLDRSLRRAPEFESDEKCALYGPSSFCSLSRRPSSLELFYRVVDKLPSLDDSHGNDKEDKNTRPVKLAVPGEQVRSSEPSPELSPEPIPELSLELNHEPNRESSSEPNHEPSPEPSPELNPEPPLEDHSIESDSDVRNTNAKALEESTSNQREASSGSSLEQPFLTQPRSQALNKGLTTSSNSTYEVPNTGVIEVPDSDFKATSTKTPLRLTNKSNSSQIIPDSINETVPSSSHSVKYDQSAVFRSIDSSAETPSKNIQNIRSLDVLAEAALNVRDGIEITEKPENFHILAERGDEGYVNILPEDYFRELKTRSVKVGSKDEIQPNESSSVNSESPTSYDNVSQTQKMLYLGDISERMEMKRIFNLVKSSDMELLESRILNSSTEENGNIILDKTLNERPGLEEMRAVYNSVNVNDSILDSNFLTSDLSNYNPIDEVIKPSPTSGMSQASEDPSEKDPSQINDDEEEEEDDDTPNLLRSQITKETFKIFLVQVLIRKQVDGLSISQMYANQKIWHYGTIAASKISHQSTNKLSRNRVVSATKGMLDELIKEGQIIQYEDNEHNQVFQAVGRWNIEHELNDSIQQALKNPSKTYVNVKKILQNVQKKGESWKHVSFKTILRIVDQYLQSEYQGKFKEMSTGYFKVNS